MNSDMFNHGLTLIGVHLLPMLTELRRIDSAALRLAKLDGLAERSDFAEHPSTRTGLAY